jgi:uncharacterized membrane protein
MSFATIVNLDLFPLGWVHFVASVAALAAGALVLLRAKGTSTHRQIGRFFSFAILVTSFTALGIYRFGTFFFAHWLAVAAIVATLIGVIAAHYRMPRFGWMHLHLTCMLASLYILIGGAVNEVFLRVNFLHRLIPNLNSPVVGGTHFALMLLFATLIAYFNAVTLIQHRSRRLRAGRTPSLHTASRE